MGLSASNHLFLNKLNMGRGQKRLYDAYKKAANPDTPTVNPETPTIPGSTFNGESFEIDKKNIEKDIENAGKTFFG